MMPRITIAIYDGNHFFEQGMRHVLRVFFTGRGWEVCFVAASQRSTADLVVCAESLNGGYPCRTHGRWCQPQTAVLVVRESDCVGRLRRAPCRSELGAITRRDTPEAVTLLVRRVLDVSTPPAQPKTERCKRCAPCLTKQERAVLLGLAWEITPVRLAQLLNLHVKTISTHKRAAMRKLGFQRNSELCHWLRQGGLEYEKRA